MCIPQSPASWDQGRWENRHWHVTRRAHPFHHPPASSLWCKQIWQHFELVRPWFILTSRLPSWSQQELPHSGVWDPVVGISLTFIRLLVQIIIMEKLFSGSPLPPLELVRFISSTESRTPWSSCPPTTNTCPSSIWIGFNSDPPAIVLQLHLYLCLHLNLQKHLILTSVPASHNVHSEPCWALALHSMSTPQRWNFVSKPGHFLTLHI